MKKKPKSNHDSAWAITDPKGEIYWSAKDGGRLHIYNRLYQARTAKGGFFKTDCPVIRPVRLVVELTKGRRRAKKT